MILVDTSVWIDHIRAGVPALVKRLEQFDVATHPFVIGELALGSLPQRELVLALLGALSTATIAHHEEVLDFSAGSGLWAGELVMWTCISSQLVIYRQECGCGRGTNA